MKIIKVLLAVVPFMLIGKTLCAQFDFPKYDDVMDIKNRQPIVIVNPPNPDIINKYDRKSKPEVVQVYEQIIANYNDNMKYAVQNFWTFNSKEILFKTREEVDEMMRDKSAHDRYFLIYCYDFEVGYKRDFDWKIDKNAQKVTGTQPYFAIGLPDERPFYQIRVPSLIPSPEYLVYFVSTANFKFKYLLKHNDANKMQNMIDENAHILAGKTLLILKDNISPKLSNAEIASFYPCNYRIVEDSEIQRVIASGDSACAYVIFCNGSTGKLDISGRSLAMNWIVNCADGNILGYSQQGINSAAMHGDVADVEIEYKNPFFVEIADFCGAGKKK